jgi:hypothetical protein
VTRKRGGAEHVRTTRPQALAPPVPQANPTPEWDAEVAAFYVSSENPSFHATGEHFGVSRETARQAVRRWESATGQTVGRAPARRRKAREEAAAAKREVKPPSLAQRLLSRAHLNKETGCWDWDGPLHSQDGKNYPSFHALGEQFAHRVSYRMWVGPIPDEHLVLRTCGRFVCIAPFHLRGVSRGEGAREWSLGGRRAPVTHCKRGHALTPDNISWNTCTEIRNGERVTKRYRLCRICLEERQRRSPRQVRPKRPPLPVDHSEREIEQTVRRVENAPPGKRADVLAWQLEYMAGITGPVDRPALPDELYDDYWTRTRGTFSEWFASRVTGSPRVQKALRGKPRNPAPP